MLEVFGAFAQSLEANPLRHVVRGCHFFCRPLFCQLETAAAAIADLIAGAHR